MINSSHWESMLKAISWRIFGTLVTVLLVFCLTSEWSISLYAGLLEMISKIILFYLHERLWIGLRLMMKR